MKLSDVLSHEVQVLVGLFGGVGLAFLFSLPMFVVGWSLHRRRKKYKAEAIEPFTELPLRPPGESLRKKIEELSEQFDSYLVASVIISVGSAMYATALIQAAKVNWVVYAFLGLLVLGSALYGWVKMPRLLRQIWDHRLGFDGERVVGESLNRLFADGFEVFHDMPFENFNIDHIIVGPPGVFAIETKTRRKPAGLKGTSKATVVYDGTALTFPRGYKNAEWLGQAERNARTLSKFLSSATGEPTPVNAILTLPGWWIDRKARGNVNVLNPKEIQHSFRNGGPPLPPDRIKRIAHQLTERCRLEKPKP